ncbi:RNA-splicing factor [Serendipita sp. 399]|nr:RNA-splicing factor [Serendipita sp. 399]
MKHREPDKEILEHERKRKVEVACYELRVQLEDDGADFGQLRRYRLPEEQIEAQVDALRAQLLEKSQNSTYTRQQFKPSDTHAILAAKKVEMERMARALGTSDSYVEGRAFDPAHAEEMKRQRIAKREDMEKEAEIRRKAKEDNEKVWKEKERLRRRAEDAARGGARGKPAPKDAMLPPPPARARERTELSVANDLHLYAAVTRHLDRVQGPIRHLQRLDSALRALRDVVVQTVWIEGVLGQGLLLAGDPGHVVPEIESEGIPVCRIHAPVREVEATPIVHGPQLEEGATRILVLAVLALDLDLVRVAVPIHPHDIRVGVGLDGIVPLGVAGIEAVEIRDLVANHPYHPHHIVLAQERGLFPAALGLHLHAVARQMLEGEARGVDQGIVNVEMLACALLVLAGDLEMVVEAALRQDQTQDL